MRGENLRERERQPVNLFEQAGLGTIGLGWAEICFVFFSLKREEAGYWIKCDGLSASLCGFSVSSSY
jgi:hypothetical protein